MVAGVPLEGSQEMATSLPPSPEGAEALGVGPSCALTSPPEAWKI